MRSCPATSGAPSGLIRTAFSDIQLVDGGSRVPDASFEDSGVSSGTTDYYRATVVDASGNESEAAHEVSATPFPSPLGWP